MLHPTMLGDVGPTCWLRLNRPLRVKVAPYSYNVSVHVLFEGLLFLFRESCGVET